jgi:hypothetical protein
MKKVSDPSQPKKPRSKHHEIIGKFVTVEFSVDKYFWPQQMKIAGQLLKKYEYQFLSWMKPPNNYKVTSLVWFLTEQGKHYLSDQLVEYHKHTVNLSPKQQEISPSTTKIGDDIQVEQKPRTLKEFLNYGKS